MKRITLITREDLRKASKLKPTEDIGIDDIASISRNLGVGDDRTIQDDIAVRHEMIPRSDMVIFHCELMKEASIIKNRVGATTGAFSLREGGEEKLMRFILGAFK